MANKFLPFPKIKQLNDAMHHARRLGHESLTYVGRPKVHGTNAAIVKTEKGIHFQSRNRVLSLDSDNAGFMNNYARFVPVFDKVMEVGDAFYGEWFGPGIHNGVAVNQISTRHFMIFACSLAGSEISTLLPAEHPIMCVPKIYTVHDFPSLEIELNVNKVDTSFLENATARFEALCPVALNFGIAGVGEGLIWSCIQYPEDHNLWFKTKGEEHATCVKKIKLKDKFEHFEEVESMVDDFLTEARLNQAFFEISGGSIEQTGDFVRWIIGDIKVECHQEIVRSNFDFKLIAKVAGRRAAIWYKRKIQEMEIG